MESTIRAIYANFLLYSRMSNNILLLFVNYHPDEEWAPVALLDGAMAFCLPMQASNLSLELWVIDTCKEHNGLLPVLVAGYRTLSRGVLV